MQDHSPAAGTVSALRRGLALLTALASHAGPVSAATLARQLELPRSTTYHLLAELQADPEDRATSDRSIISASPSTQRNARLRLPGRRCVADAGVARELSE